MLIFYFVYACILSVQFNMLFYGCICAYPLHIFYILDACACALARCTIGPLTGRHVLLFCLICYKANLQVFFINLSGIFDYTHPFPNANNLYLNLLYRNTGSPFFYCSCNCQTPQKHRLGNSGGNFWWLILFDIWDGMWLNLK